MSKKYAVVSDFYNPCFWKVAEVEELGPNKWQHVHDGDVLVRILDGRPRCGIVPGPGEAWVEGTPMDSSRFFEDKERAERVAEKLTDSLR